MMDSGLGVSRPPGAQQRIPPVNDANDPYLSLAPRILALSRELAPDQRARIEEFEQQVVWLSQYMRSSSEFDAGAAIALFLANMSRSMDSVPKMHAEMQVMNAKMNALPVLANEVASINAKMAVMAANMDSTMGRAGRMMPWGW